MINRLVTPPGIAEISGMPGVDPAWSRLVQAKDSESVPRTWHVLDNGVAPEAGTLLCVHGNPTWSYLWRRFLSCADPGWRVVAVDQLGMGYSERPNAPRTLAARIDDLDTITSELEITGHVVLAAHDWGGPISLGWAQRHLDQITGLILTNTGVAVPPKTETPALIRLARSRMLRELVCVRTTTFVRAAAALSGPQIPAEVRSALRAPYSSSSRRQAIAEFVADIPLSRAIPAVLHSIASRSGSPTSEAFRRCCCGAPGTLSSRSGSLATWNAGCRMRMSTGTPERRIWWWKMLLTWPRMPGRG